MNRLVSLQETTVELHNLLAKKAADAERDETIEHATRLLDRREQLMEKVLPPFSPEEQVTGRELVQLNLLIQQQLGTLFEAVKIDIKTIKQKKKSNGHYANPYQVTASSDGMFLDRKK